MFKLKHNPFEHQATIDFEDYKSQPFILEGLEIPKQLSSKLSWNFTSPNRILIKIIALRGFGKSTISFFLQDTIKKKNSSSILSYYINDSRIDYYTLLRNMVQEFQILKLEKTHEEVIRGFLEDKKLYLFIDFQDFAETRNLKILSQTLESLHFLSKNISVILTMNKTHALKMENISYVLGKYTQFELKPFSLKNTINLIKERLKRAREPNSKNEIYPFNQNIIKMIFNHSGGIPRNILSACDLLITSSNGYEFDEELVSETLTNEFSKKVIFDMTEDGKEREYLLQLYHMIKEDFKGEVFKEKDLHEKLSEGLGWSNKTSRKRIRKLNKFGLLTITKGDNLWNNTIRII